jgi:4-amino-4-deoxy-L-arabinose transferase-like glycosyltransferase
MNHTNNHVFWEALGLGIFFIILFLLFVGDHHLISPDETRYVGIAWEMYHKGDYITPRLADSPFLGKPILFYWLNILAFHLFGVGEFAARFFPAITGAIACIMAFIYGRIVFNRRTGLLMSMVMAASPLFFGFTHFANMDGEVASWLSCSLLSFLIAHHYLSRNFSAAGWLYLAYFFAALAFLTKGLIGIVLPGMIIFFWLLILNEWRLLLKIRLASGLLLFLVIVTPWLYWCEKANPGFLYYFFVFNHFYRFVGEHFNNQQPFFFYIPYILIGIFPFSLFIIQGWGSHIKDWFSHLKGHRHSLFIGLWMVLVTLFFSIPVSKPLGHIAPAMPAPALLIGMYFSRIWPSRITIANKISSWLFIIVITIMAMGLFFLPSFIDNRKLPDLMPYAYLLGTMALIFAGIIGFWLIQDKLMSYIITTLIMMTFVINVTLIASLKHFDLQHNWPIAQKLLPYAKQFPKAQVVMMDNYYYALPMYLNQDVYVAYPWDQIHQLEASDGWEREIYDGIEYIDNQKRPETLLNYHKLRQLWHSDQKVMMATSTSRQKLKAILNTTQIKQVGFVPRRSAHIYINPAIQSALKKDQNKKSSK